MQAKKIIIKTLSPLLNADFCNNLKHYPKINFINKKINGEFITIIKCHNYYNSSISTNVYSSYVYLYTTVSIIISELIINHFEKKIISRLLGEYFFYFSPRETMRIEKIASLILDQNYPSDNSKQLYLYKKDLVFSELLSNFRKRNYIVIEGFANFMLSNYYLFLEDVIEKSAHIYFSNRDHADLINFILNNLLN